VGVLIQQQHGSPPCSGVQGQSPGRSPPEAEAFFVNECLNFDVLE